MNIEKAEQLVKRIWKDLQLTYINFRWGNMKRGYGYYYFNKGKEEIVMSKPLTLLNSEYSFKNSLLHEISHALVGHANGHNIVWRRMAHRLGCDGKRCYSELKIPKGKYVYKCPKCKTRYHLYRQLTRQMACEKCCKKFNKGKFSKKYIIKKLEK